MSDKEAQVDWDDDGFTDACYERVRQLRAELTQARAELAAVDKGLSEFYSFYDDHGVCVMRQELERLRAELAAVDEALAEFYHSSSEDHGVFAMRQNLDRARSVVAARNIELTRALNEHNEAEVEMEGLRRQLKHIETEGDKLRDKLVHAKGECGTLEQGGKRADYIHKKPPDDIAQALQAERRLRREAEIELRNSHKILAEAEQDYSALIRRHGILEQRAKRAEAALATERQLRQEAEKRAENREAELINGHKALTAAGVVQSDASGYKYSIAGRVVKLRKAGQRAETLEQERDEWCGDWESVTAELLNTRDRLAEAEQRAKLAEAQLDNGHGALTSAGVPRRDASGKLSICGRVMRLKRRIKARDARLVEIGQRAERAEAANDHLRSIVEYEYTTRTELDDGHEALEAANIPFVSEDGTILSIANRIARLKQYAIEASKWLAASRRRANEAVSQLERAEAVLAQTREETSRIMHEGLKIEAERDYWLGKHADAEALAALVTPETAALLERLGTSWTTTLPDDGDTALALATQIREALNEH